MFFVIVLYKCKLSDSTSYCTLVTSLKTANRTASLYIWDNSPAAQPVLINDYCWNEIIYKHCPENAGLSVAYNTAASKAGELGFGWIGLFDQDTAFNKDYVQKLEDAMNKHPGVNLFVPIIRLANGRPLSPAVYRHQRGYQKHLQSGLYSLVNYLPINSGMVINVEAFVKCGGYNPKVRLDFADAQFIERFRKLNHSFFLFDSVAVQNFANNEQNMEKLAGRFRLFCTDAKNCEKHGLLNRAGYFYTVTRHLMSLIFRTKNIQFVKIFLKEYLLS